MRRRPLLRAAAISGGAFYAGRRRAAAQLRAADRRTRGSGRPAVIEQLRELGRLREQGVLTDAEFAAQKSKILEA
jgi:hypothetical protein